MKKKLVLINPVNPNRKGLSETRSSSYPPLGLGIIAALTPDNWDIKIIDENFEKFQFEEADLVGITAFTAAINRAYEIAEVYRKKNIHTVIGGIHASMLPEEAGQFVDTVVKGEGESVWPQLIKDFENNEIKPLYTGNKRDMENIPFPRNDLFHKNYIFTSIQTARGCPMDCEFCSVTPFSGKFYCQRPIKDVLDELEKAPKKLVCFVDDNILGYGKKAEQRAIELFKGIIDRKLDIQWFSHASINVVENEEVVKLAAESGCRAFFIGIEAETMDALHEINKYMNVKKVQDKYKHVYRKLHKYGIVVVGAMIYGMDTDTKKDLKKRRQYMIRSGIDIMQALPLTPLPGTRLLERLKKENRLLLNNYPDDWEKHDVTEVVFKPGKMSETELQETMDKIWSRMYNMKIVLYKAIKTWWQTKSLSAAKWAFWGNVGYHNFLHPKKKYAKD
jgi:radical SAM superfamily enzyme YgiQ (UPF0313 family)